MNSPRQTSAFDRAHRSKSLSLNIPSLQNSITPFPNGAPVLRSLGEGGEFLTKVVPVREGRPSVFHSSLFLDFQLLSKLAKKWRLCHKVRVKRKNVLKNYCGWFMRSVADIRKDLWSHTTTSYLFISSPSWLFSRAWPLCLFGRKPPRPLSRSRSS